MCRENGAFPFSVTDLVFPNLLSIWKGKPNSPVNNFPVFSVKTIFFSFTAAPPFRKGSFVLSVVLSLSGERGSGERTLQLCLTCHRSLHLRKARSSLSRFGHHLGVLPADLPVLCAWDLMPELTDSGMYLTQGGPAGTFLGFFFFPQTETKQPRCSLEVKLWDERLRTWVLCAHYPAEVEAAWLRQHRQRTDVAEALWSLVQAVLEVLQLLFSSCCSVIYPYIRLVNSPLWVQSSVSFWHLQLKKETS